MSIVSFNKPLLICKKSISKIAVSVAFKLIRAESSKFELFFFLSQSVSNYR